MGPFPGGVIETKRDPGDGIEADADQDGDVGHKEAQYLSANCVLFMNYTGDAASVVDQHFTRALNPDASIANAAGASSEPKGYEPKGVIVKSQFSFRLPLN